MKKSEAFRLAAHSVMRDNSFTNQNKTDILRVLFAEEDLAAYIEKKELEKQEKENE